MALRQSTGFRNLLAGINTEMITNGTFTADVTSWTPSTATITYTAGPTDGRANVATVAGSAGYASQSITTKVGHFYKISFYHNATGGQGYVYVGTSAGGSQNYASPVLSTTGSWTLVTAGFVATATTTHISLGTNGTGNHYYDSVSVVWMARSWQDVFNAAKIYFYSGTIPTTPDDAQSSTLLCTVSNAGSGVTWKDASSGATGKTVGETWSGTCVASGTVGWFRIQHPDDSLTASSTTIARVDGTCGTSGADINFTGGLYFASGSVQTLSDFVPTEPMSN